MELVNIHSHTKYSGHGEGTIEEVVAAAAAAGVATLALTEHYPLSDAVDAVRCVSMMPEFVPTYLETIERMRVEYPQVEILTGTELDWLGPCEDRTFASDEFAPFDVVLGSVHYVDLWPFDDPAQRDRWNEPGAADFIWRRYAELWCEAVCAKDRPFTIMSHPDLAKKFGFYPSFDLEPLYRDMVDAIAGTDRMVEVNTSGLYYACKEMFPAPQLLAMFCWAGVPCTIGTDAHAPANVARSLQEGYRMMYEAGYREVTVPMRGGDRRTVPLI